MLEIVTKKDKSRISRTSGKGSTTVFDSIESAMQWANENNLEPANYEVKPANIAIV